MTATQITQLKLIQRDIDPTTPHSSLRDDMTVRKLSEEVRELKLVVKSLIDILVDQQ